ncbi:RING finger protein 32 [Labeo rohita]|uniref:RING finger protein 32 n=1 Tax=Labeo rohita TaxID=84645 RepID=A0ABQ8MK08_LABRO|nr:RING finger protein 32 [Labeo rohita]
MDYFSLLSCLCLAKFTQKFSKGLLFKTSHHRPHSPRFLGHRHVARQGECPLFSEQLFLTSQNDLFETPELMVQKYFHSWERHTALNGTSLHSDQVNTLSVDSNAAGEGFGCKAERGRLTLAAVALQDHITRSIPVRSIPCNLPVSHVRRHKSHNTRQCIIFPEQTQGQEEKEYVLDRGPPPLTLAQRMGLVAAPSRRLTAEEWAEVKTRSIQEGDSTQPCSICREEFRLQPQVLLSCSHVFHKVCLKSFEKFSGRKSCPMCRTEQYETRVIYDGARLYREKCAVRIQAFWRGYLVRKWYSNVKKYVPPKDQQLRRRFFEKKFQEMNDSLVQSCSMDVEAFLSDIDRSVATSHHILRRFADKYAGASEMEDKDWLEAQEKSLLGPALRPTCRHLSQSARAALAAQMFQFNSIKPSTRWQHYRLSILTYAVQRGVQDCPICLNHLGSSKDDRNVLLLSCSHLFHEPCLQAFERFCHEVKPTCPLCRSHYAKMLVSH